MNSGIFRHGSIFWEAVLKATNIFMFEVILGEIRIKNSSFLNEIWTAFGCLSTWSAFLSSKKHIQGFRRPPWKLSIFVFLVKLSCGFPKYKNGDFFQTQLPKNLRKHFTQNVNESLNHRWARGGVLPRLKKHFYDPPPLRFKMTPTPSEMAFDPL